MTESKIPHPIHSLEDFSAYYLKNHNPDPKKDISYRGINLNTNSVRDLLRKTISSTFDREYFFKALRKIDPRIGPLLKKKETTKIMFHLTKVARHNLTFNEIEYLFLFNLKH